jgi:hypothetical protein
MNVGSGTIPISSSFLFPFSKAKQTRQGENEREKRKRVLYRIPTRLEVKSVLDRASLTVVKALKVRDDDEEKRATHLNGP